jgi:type II secretory pathway component GspD/PulD (secretin)
MRFLPLLACAFLLTVVAPSFGQPRPVPKKTDEKRLTIKFENAKWSDVLVWFADQTDTPFVGSARLTGTFTFIGPKDRSYTINEIVDILNEALAPLQYRLVRRTESFTIVGESDKLDVSQVPIVRVDELPSRGRTEVARVLVSLKALTPEDIAPQVKKLLSPNGDVFVLADRLVLQDTVGNLRQILQAIKELDDHAPDAKRPQPAAPQFRKYTLPTASAEPTLRVLQQFFQNTRSMRMSVIGNNTLLVWASPNDHEQVEAILQSIPMPAIEVIPLNFLQSARTVETLRAMFRSAAGLYLEADASRDAVIVRGNPEQIKEVKAALVQLGEAPVAMPARIISIEQGNAATLADEIYRLMKEMKPNPVQIITPDKKPEPLKPKPDPKNPGKTLPPLTLTVLGNKLIATCDDPELLVLIQELSRLTTRVCTFGDFQILPLRSASAQDMARLLHEAFNSLDAAQPARVRIVADPASNSLLVQANPLDYLEIKRLLAALDVPHGEAEADVSNLVVLLKFAKAADVAKTIVDVYRPKDARRGSISVSVDERTNTLVVRGTQMQIKEVKALIDQLDAPK